VQRSRPGCGHRNESLGIGLCLDRQPVISDLIVGEVSTYLEEVIIEMMSKSLANPSKSNIFGELIVSSYSPLYSSLVMSHLGAGREEWKVPRVE
jgi:hypothetical protein